MGEEKTLTIPLGPAQKIRDLKIQIPSSLRFPHKAHSSWSLRTRSKTYAQDC